MPVPPESRISRDELRTDCTGRWIEIVTALTGFAPEYFSGRHQSCPKCGGTDRFRAYDDFAETGGIICNQCAPKGLAEGMATVQWLLGVPFPAALEKIAEYIGHRPGQTTASPPAYPSRGSGGGGSRSASSKGPGPTKGKGAAAPATNGYHLAKGRANADPNKGVEWDRDWPAETQEAFFSRLAQAKPPIAATAGLAFSARRCRFPRGASGMPCWAFPVRQPDGDSPDAPTGWVLLRESGHLFAPSPDGSLKARKVHMVRGTTNGWIYPGSTADLLSATGYIKVEGPTDALAVHAVLPPGWTVITNACGAKGVSSSRQPIDYSFAAGKPVVIIGDADQPGQDGAAAFARAFAAAGAMVRVATLPYPVVPDHGKDIRDWLGEPGHGAGEFEAMISAAEEWREVEGREEGPNCENGSSEPADEFEASISAPSDDDDSSHGDDPGLPDGESADATDDATDDPLRRIDEQFRYALTDLGNANRFAALHRGRALHVYRWGKWLAWDGQRWRLDVSGAITRMASEVAADVNTEAKALISASKIDEDEASAALSWIIKSEFRPRIEACISLAASREGMSVEHENLDADHWRLNAANGMVDLQTGDLTPHDSSALQAKLCPTAYDPDATCPQWEAFLEGIFGGDPELIEYIQRLFGYSLTGSVQEQILPIFHGGGSNGKSALIDITQHVIGHEYTWPAPSNFLSVRNQEAHPTEKASLFRRRLVFVVETKEHHRLDESLVKELTGGERISARRMREDFWEFDPTHKIILCTNHKPVIKGTDHGIWRRLQLIPFAQRYWDPDKGETGPREFMADKQLPTRIKATESPGILAWMVRGCLAWQRYGLDAPGVVREASASYRTSQDVLAGWIEECCVTGSSQYRIKASDLFTAYQEWCEQNNERAMTQTAFGERMTERGVERVKLGGFKWYIGIDLKHEAYQ